ncbi:thioredoxin domain-containing protein [Pseudonocardia spinosispora]|uniref:thioredoxin domain-containing protein n=1 Tax=Pseudonocardia spinosispora TaxID=103441 RepID=UPI000419FBC0|nr:thioredoxin domain-containing protein [Pseudonocardia spinosispora]
MPSKQAKKARAAQKRKAPVVAERKGLSPALIAGIVVVVLFAVAVGFGVYRAQSKATEAAGAVPPAATTTGVPVGKPDAPATVDIYLDFQCPVCRIYEETVGPAIDSLIANGSAKVIYHPLAFLDQASSDQYSTRSSSAAGCASQANVFPQFAKLLYANQPPEGGAGLPDSQLIALGKQAGAPDSFAQCVTNKTYKGWSAKLTDEASKAGVNATPTVMVNGKKIGNTEAELREAVTAAGK